MYYYNHILQPSKCVANDWARVGLRSVSGVWQWILPDGSGLPVSLNEWVAKWYKTSIGSLWADTMFISGYYGAPQLLGDNSQAAAAHPVICQFR